MWLELTAQDVEQLLVQTSVDSDLEEVGNVVENLLGCLVYLELILLMHHPRSQCVVRPPAHVLATLIAGSGCVHELVL